MTNEQPENRPKKQKKQKKQPRLKARLPRGFVDRDAADIRATEKMLATIKEVFERYGFDPVETPMFEYTDALGKFLPDTDRPNEGVFSLQDDAHHDKEGEWMSLRYDLTAPLARHFAQNIHEMHTPYRTYRAGYVFRNEKPGPGRFRQFMQFDADTVGAPNPSADAEMCMMMADTMEALGLKGQYIVRVNNRKVLDGVMECLNIYGSQRLATLRSMDAFDKIGEDGVRKRLGEGRLDASGDRTEGAGLTEEAIDELIDIFISPELDKVISKFTNLTDDEFNTLSDMLSGADEADFDELESLPLDVLRKSKFMVNGAFSDGVKELVDIAKLVRAAGYGPGRIVVDPTCVRGLEYYTGTVFECELTFPVTNEKGETVTFGSVAGGGRYDGLVKRFTGQDIPATGFSIGVSRLMTALKNLGKLEADTVQGPVVVCVMDKDTKSLAGYQQMVQELRSANIRAEMYQGNPNQKLGKQIHYADQRGSPIAIIEGSDERERGEVQVKDLIEGMRLSQEITDNEEWRASRPAQHTIKREALVDTVREILDAQAADLDG